MGRLVRGCLLTWRLKTGHSGSARPLHSGVVKETAFTSMLRVSVCVLVCGPVSGRVIESNRGMQQAIMQYEREYHASKDEHVPEIQDAVGPESGATLLSTVFCPPPFPLQPRVAPKRCPRVFPAS
jgi:hypothetical protein